MNTLYTILQSAHSGFRWITLILLLLTIIRFFIQWRKSSAYKKFDKNLFTINLSAMHVQVLIGIGLYFLSPKVLFSAHTMSIKIFRFFTVEHALMMLIAVVLLTIASSKIKKKNSDTEKFKIGFWYSFIALILILLAIPWPFRGLGTTWF
jgi:heme A synthase